MRLEYHIVKTILSEIFGLKSIFLWKHFPEDPRNQVENFGTTSVQDCKENFWIVEHVKNSKFTVEYINISLNKSINRWIKIVTQLNAQMIHWIKIVLSLNVEIIRWIKIVLLLNAWNCFVEFSTFDQLYTCTYNKTCKIKYDETL